MGVRRQRSDQPRVAVTSICSSRHIQFLIIFIAPQYLLITLYTLFIGIKEIPGVNYHVNYQKKAQLTFYL